VFEAVEWRCPNPCRINEAPVALGGKVGKRGAANGSKGLLATGERWSVESIFKPWLRCLIVPITHRLGALSLTNEVLEGGIV
jgi:hypothetical protein